MAIIGVLLLLNILAWSLIVIGLPEIIIAYISIIERLG